MLTPDELTQRFGPVPDEPPHRDPIQWCGECNRCGLCCTMEVKGEHLRGVAGGAHVLRQATYTLVCEHLRARLDGGHAKPLGAPDASYCAVYERRVDGMPIRMLDHTGTPRMVGQCRKHHWLEDERIIARGLGKGCSLRIAEPGAVPLNTFIPQAPKVR
jgi:hypothetical protein